MDKIDLLVDSYIHNDRGDLREKYFNLCIECGLHDSSIPAEDYKWAWIYETGLGILQHAPERRYVRDKHEVTLGLLKELEEI